MSEQTSNKKSELQLELELHDFGNWGDSPVPNMSHMARGIDTLEVAEEIKLNEEDTLNLLDVLENPRKPNENLVLAAKHYKETFQAQSISVPPLDKASETKSVVELEKEIFGMQLFMQEMGIYHMWSDNKHNYLEDK